MLRAQGRHHGPDEQVHRAVTEKKQPKACSVCGAPNLIEHGNRLLEMDPKTDKFRYRSHEYDGPGAPCWD